jgi:hypothetical protein
MIASVPTRRSPLLTHNVALTSARHLSAAGVFFLCKDDGRADAQNVSLCPSGPNWRSRDLGALASRGQSLAVLDDQIGDSLVAADLADRLCRM